MVEKEGENALLAREMAINGRFGDTDLCCDSLYRKVFAEKDA